MISPFGVVLCRFPQVSWNCWPLAHKRGKAQSALGHMKASASLSSRLSHEIKHCQKSLSALSTAIIAFPRRKILLKSPRVNLARLTTLVNGQRLHNNYVDIVRRLKRGGLACQTRNLVIQSRIIKIPKELVSGLDRLTCVRSILQRHSVRRVSNGLCP